MAVMGEGIMGTPPPVSLWEDKQATKKRGVLYLKDVDGHASGSLNLNFPG